jgi:Na+/H+-dicarboxylate symporter
MAAQGLRDMDDGPEKIANAEELAAVKRLGRRVMLSVAVTTVLATALFVLAP